MIEINSVTLYLSGEALPFCSKTINMGDKIEKGTRVTTSNGDVYSIISILGIDSNRNNINLRVKKEK